MSPITSLYYNSRPVASLLIAGSRFPQILDLFQGSEIGVRMQSMGNLDF